MTEPAVDEAYEEYRKDKSSAIKKTQRSFTKNQLILLILIVGVGIYLVFIKKIFEKNSAVLIVAVIVALIYILTNKDDAESKIITLREATAIVQKEMGYMQNVTKQIPSGITHYPPISKLKHLDGNPVKWRIALEIETIRSKHKQYIVEVEPYDGYIMGVYEATRGFKDIDKPDLRYILPKEQKWAKQYEMNYDDFRPR